MDGRFRSQVVPRKTSGINELAVKFAKSSKRSKSTENNLAKEPPSYRLCEKEEMEDPMTMLNKRWSVIAKTQDTMTKQELLNNYRMLMNDHLRLERFLSIVTKDNEMARTRLETDLLDAMMCIEDLKQALEVRLARRRKIDPREAEERRALIRQNKKLLNQLYESAKKIETLELTKLEMKEQLELLDFQMVEVENQKAMVEEELRRQPMCHHSQTQTQEDPEAGAAAVAMARAETSTALAELASQKAEVAATHAKHRHLENLVRDLRHENSELRDQIAHHEDDSENSLAESDKHSKSQYFQIELETMTKQLSNLQECLAKSEATCDNLRAQINSRQTDGDVKNHDLKRLQVTIQRGRGPPEDSIGLDDDCVTEEGSLLLTKSTIHQLEAELESAAPITAESLVYAVRNLKRLRNSLLSADLRQSVKNGPSSPDYYSARLAQLQNNTEADGLRAQLAVVEKRRTDLEIRLNDLTAELAKSQAENRSNDAWLTAARRTEAALRRRLLASMDTAMSSNQRGRPISSVDFAGSNLGGSPPFTEECEAQTKIIKLEAINASLTDASHLDRARLQDQTTRIAQLEAEHRTLHERMSSMQASEACAQRSSVRLKALYEDMLREFSEASTQESKAASGRGQFRGVSDSRGYETDTAVLGGNPNISSVDDPANMMKSCGSKACVELRAVLGSLEERFIHTAEQLAEAETLIAEMENFSNSKEPANNGMSSSTANKKSTSGACFSILEALRIAIRGYHGNDTTITRLMSRLERWVSARLTHSSAIEAELWRQIDDLQMALADEISPQNADKVLQATIQFQRNSLADLSQKFEQACDNLEATKALCEIQGAELTQFRAAALGH